MAETTDRRQVPMWYPMRISYGRDERMIRIKQQLDKEGLENFLPMRYEYTQTDDWDVRKKLVPAIHGLIFIRSTQDELTRLKLTRTEFTPLRYMTNLLERDNKILTVPERQMENFMRVASVRDGSVVFLDYTDFIAKPGKEVRITQGQFAGATGVIKRIKKSQCVVVQIKGIAAVAITFVPQAWLEEISTQN